MRRMIVAGTSLLVLAGCGGSRDAVGANSPDSITTTAVGNVVATIPSPTPSPTPPMAANAASAADAMAGNVMSNDTTTF